MLNKGNKQYKIYLLIFICLFGREIHAQTDGFGVRYSAANSMTFIDIEYSEKFLLGLTGDFSYFDLLLIDTDNYQVIDSLSLDSYNFELVDLYKGRDGFKLIGVDILDSTINSMKIEIENNTIAILPRLYGELPFYYMQGLERFGLPYTVILEALSFNEEDFGCISNFPGISILFKIVDDSISFKIPTPTLAWSREVKVIDSLLFITSLHRVSIVDLSDLKPVKSIFDADVFRNSGWIYGWDSIYIFTDQLNSSEIFASLVSVKFLDQDFSIIKTDTIGHQDSLNLNALNSPVSFYNDSNNIYLSGSQGGKFSLDRKRNFINSFYLTSYNKSLEQDWFLELSNDGNYAMNGVLTLENDNALIYGYEGREERDWKAYPFLIEIDKEGYVVSSTRPMEHRTNEIVLYPNPASDNLYVKLEGNDDRSFDISIFDQSGKLVMIKRGISDQENINISSMPQGMYYLSLTREGKRWASRKFVKAN